jgi:CheY-like chemotaxis protein
LTSVLVVDDDPRILRIFSSFLRAEGYEVATATDGADGLALLTSDPPSAVILDLNMPGLPGVDVFREARRSGYDGPIVVISADARAEQIARSLGADACLTKPFDPSDLCQLLEQLTASHQVTAT